MLCVLGGQLEFSNRVLPGQCILIESTNWFAAMLVIHTIAGGGGDYSIPFDSFQ